MAYLDHKGFIHSAKAASAVNPHQAVELVGTTLAIVLPLATNGREGLGVVDASAPAEGQVTIYGQDNLVRGIAVASLGVGADVAAASANGALGPVVGASGITRWRVGKAVEAAAAGERFTFIVSPRQLSNLI